MKRKVQQCHAERELIFSAPDVGGEYVILTLKNYNAWDYTSAVFKRSIIAKPQVLDTNRSTRNARRPHTRMLFVTKVCMIRIGSPSMYETVSLRAFTPWRTTTYSFLPGFRNGKRMFWWEKKDPMKKSRLLRRYLCSITSLPDDPRQCDIPKRELFSYYYKKEAVTRQCS